jgi:hypothetical protein
LFSTRDLVAGSMTIQNANDKSAHVDAEFDPAGVCICVARDSQKFGLSCDIINRFFASFCSTWPLAYRRPKTCNV